MLMYKEICMIKRYKDVNLSEFIRYFTKNLQWKCPQPALSQKHLSQVEPLKYQQQPPYFHQQNHQEG